MVKLKYKIVYGYEPDNYIPIDADELEKAIYAHMTLARAAFRSGSADFSRGGIFIQPDFTAAMGWTRGYKLGVEDFAEIERHGMDTKHRMFEQKTKDRIEYLVKEKQEHLIGKNVEIPQLERPTVERREGKIKQIKELL